MKKLKTLLLLVITLSFLFYPKEVKAVGFDLSVSPAIFQIELTPPALAKAEKTLLLENTGDEPLTLALSFKPFVSSNKENGEIVFTDEIPSPDPEIFSRIQLLSEGEKVTTLTLSPKQKKELDLVITIPKDEPPGDYYFTILFSAQQVEETGVKDDSTTISQGAIGTHVLLSIGPKTKTTGAIEEFSSPFFVSSGPVPFTVRIKNNSRHFIYPKGQIILTNMFGQTIGKVDLLPVNILSETVRSLPSKEQFQALQKVQDAKKSEREDDKETLKSLEILEKFPSPIALWPETFLLGPYKATLTVALSDEGPLYTRTIHFMAFPFQLLIGVVIILLIILLIRARLKARG